MKDQITNKELQDILKQYPGNAIVLGGENGTLWKTEQLEFIDDFKPDYWEKLKHQYAGMAMQGILTSDKLLGILGIQKGKELDAMIGDMSVKISTALVNRLKEEEK